jgi:hypothetical protein
MDRAATSCIWQTLVSTVNITLVHHGHSLHQKNDGTQEEGPLLTFAAAFSLAATFAVLTVDSDAATIQILVIHLDLCARCIIWIGESHEA